MKNLLTVLFCLSVPLIKAEIFLGQGSMVGEVSQTSAILQTRLTASEKLVEGDVLGAAGFACFEIGITRALKEPKRTSWVKSQAHNDFIVKFKVSDLKPDTRYFYRVIYGPNKSDVKRGPVGSFSTLQGATGSKEVSFVVVTGMNYMSFHYGKLGKVDPKTKMRTRILATSYQGKDKALGFPALETIGKLKKLIFGTLVQN